MFRFNHYQFGQNMQIILTIILSISVFALPAQVLEEVVVTAQKREQSIQNVGISITAFNGEQLRDAGITSTDELDNMTPGLLIRNGAAGPTVTEFSIRGVSQNDFGDHNEAPVAVYTDGTYISYYGGLGFGMFDIERVEVLRGPQGTLFGRNATGGLVHLISKKPTEEFEAYADVTVAEYDQIKFEGAVSGALSDQLLGRIAVMTNNHDGYIENRIGRDVAGNDAYAFRGQLLFKATDSLELLLNIRGSVDDDVGAGAYTHVVTDEDTGVEIGPGDVNTFCQNNFGFSPVGTDCSGFREPDDDPFTGSFDGALNFDREVYGVTGTITWEFDNITFTSITDFLTLNKEYSEDSDSSPNPVFDSFSDQHSDQISQELRLSGENDNFRWLAGFYYLNIDGNYLQGGEVPGFFGSFVDWTLETTSWAVFGQAEYDLTPELTFIGGLRWTEDEKDATQSLICLFVCGPGPLTVPMADLAKSNGDYSFKAQLNWQMNDDTLLFAGVTRGNKAGGFSFAPFVSINTFAGVPPYEPEVLTNYEGGFKTTFGNGLYRLNGSVFYYDYEDYQAFSLPAPFTQLIVNVDAEVIGAELEFFANPWQDWEFQIGVGWLDTEAKNVPTGPGILQNQELPQSPKFTVNGLVRKSWSAFNGKIAAQIDFSYVDKRQQAILNSNANSLKEYVLSNGRIGYTSGDESWDVSLFVKNLTDAEFYPVRFGSGNGQDIRVYNPPRWIGGQFRYNWK